ncbi:MAG: chemotaxis protein CheX [Opitutaceae bacterium]|nr:chemotaxis protein CheX [Opitutaceae bacterium]
MPSLECISDQAIKSHITRAVHEVFTTMLGQNPRPMEGASETGGQPWPPLSTREGVHPPHIVGTVGFIGEVNGLIYLYLPEPFARLATCRLLGLDQGDLGQGNEEAAINDAIGELTNMTVGVFKNGLCDSGYSCRLTIPSILRGRDFCIEPVKSVLRRVFYFDCAGHRVVTDLLMKFGDSSP